MDGIEAVFHPRAVAVLGASGRAANPFARPLHYLAEYGFDGAIYPVNPGYDELAGMPCYPSLGELPGPVDLVLMLVPATRVVDELPAVAAAGATAVVVFASGFGELAAGAALQAELVERARELGIRVLGPNCQGVIHTGTNLFGTFTASLESGPVAPGGLAYIGQSGAVGGSILSLAAERGLGVAAWASTGNQADLDAVELARFLVEDDTTRVLALYLESAVDDREFLELAARVRELGKALLVLRSATSAAGARAAASHTGAIIGDDAGYRVIVREYGVVEAEDVDEFIALAHGLVAAPWIVGQRVGVVTTSGGAGSLAADQLSAAGLVVEDLDPTTRAEVGALIPSFGAADNPVDVTAQIFSDSDPSAFVAVCDRVYRASGVDAVLVTLTLVTGTLATRMAEAFVERWPAPEKPVLLVWMAARDQTADARAVLRDAGWPIYDSARQAARVLRALHRPCTEPVPVAKDLQVPDIVPPVSGRPVTEAEGAALLDGAGVRRPSSSLVRDAAQARALRPSSPSVLKIQAPGVLHKSDRGGVRMDVPPEKVPAVVDELLTTFADDAPIGVLVQERLDAGPELIVGVTKAPGGIPLLTVGLGGTATEIYRDTATTFAPVSAESAERLIRSLTAAPLLTGYRGGDPVDVAAAAAAVSRISLLAVALGDRLTELEVNPLRLGPSGATALDFLLLGPAPEPHPEGAH